jgi:hypothetical protein
MREYGSVSIPQAAINAALRMGEEWPMTGKVYTGEE